MVHSSQDTAAGAADGGAFSAPSIISLLAANLLPLVGVFFFGWTAFSVVALYWAENVCVGVVNVLKMIACRPDADSGSLAGVFDSSQLDESQRDQYAESVKQMQQLVGHGAHAAKLFLIPFFIVHFGIFCLVHGVFVFVLLGGDGSMFAAMSVRGALDRLYDEGLMWAVAGLAASHLVSFFVDYIGRGEYRRTNLTTLMMQPYGRIVLLHVTLLLGGFAIAFLNSPALLLAIFVLGKTFAEFKLQGLSLIQLTSHKSFE